MKATRLSVDQYMMSIAWAIRARGNCRGRTVGAVIVKDRRIISTGYNGTPYGMANCDEDGGCMRCRDREKYPSGTSYDLCICVHAEQNAILAAARFGIATEGAVIYTTLKPCFSCLKEALQAKIVGIYYDEEWQELDKEKKQQYNYLADQFTEGIEWQPTKGVM